VTKAPGSPPSPQEPDHTEHGSDRSDHDKVHSIARLDASEAHEEDPGKQADDSADDGPDDCSDDAPSFVIQRSAIRAAFTSAV
jgi:hypothetical protein